MLPSSGLCPLQVASLAFGALEGKFLEHEPPFRTEYREGCDPTQRTSLLAGPECHRLPGAGQGGQLGVGVGILFRQLEESHMGRGESTVLFIHSAHSCLSPSQAYPSICTCHPASHPKG